jgi:hypothetical protein
MGAAVIAEYPARVGASSSVRSQNFAQPSIDEGCHHVT